MTGLSRLQQLLISANERWILGACHRLERETTGQLHGVVSAQGVTIDHFERAVHYRIRQSLGEKSGFLTCCRNRSNTAFAVFGSLSPARSRRLIAERASTGDNANRAKAVFRSVTCEFEKAFCANLLHVQFDEGACIEVVERQIQRLSRKTVAERFSPRMEMGTKSGMFLLSIPNID